MATNVLWQITRNALYSYGVQRHGFTAKEAAAEGSPKIAQLYFYIQLYCLQSIAASSPLLSPYPLLGQPIRVLTSVVGWSLLARVILDVSKITPDFVNFFLKKFDTYVEFFSKGVNQALLIHATALFILKRDIFALSAFTYSLVHLVLGKKTFPRLQEPIRLFHKTLEMIGQQFCYPLWIGIPQSLFILLFHLYRKAKRADPALDGYKKILILHYTEGLKELQTVVDELKEKFPNREDELNQIINDIKEDFDFSRPGDWAVFHEIHFLKPSLPFLEKLPERKAQLEELAAKVKNLAKEKLKGVKYALILGAEIIKAEEQDDFEDLRNIVRQFRHPANLYSGTYFGPQDSPNYRPHKEILLSEEALAARAALI